MTQSEIQSVEKLVASLVFMTNALEEETDTLYTAHIDLARKQVLQWDERSFEITAESTSKGTETL